MFKNINLYQQNTQNIIRQGSKCKIGKKTEKYVGFRTSSSVRAKRVCNRGWGPGGEAPGSCWVFLLSQAPLDPYPPPHKHYSLQIQTDLNNGPGSSKKDGNQT